MTLTSVFVNAPPVHSSDADRLVAVAGELARHRSLVAQARTQVGADWAALLDGAGRVLVADVPIGYEPAPARPARWRSCAGGDPGDLALLVIEPGGFTLAVGRAAPLDGGDRRALTRLREAFEFDGGALSR